MYVKKEYAEKLFELTSQKVLDKNVKRFIDTGFIDAFQMILNDIAKERKYSEGERITDDDLAMIKNTVKLTLNGMKDMMAEQPISLEEIEKKLGKKRFLELDELSESDRRKAVDELEKENKLSRKDRLSYDPFKPLVTLNDYLYSMAMKTLGCPDIPEAFGEDVQDAIKVIALKAESSIRRKDYYKFSVEKTYANQRWKDAEEVISSTERLQGLIKDNKATPLDVAHYASEYYALKKRQEGHGRVWRFFHSDENKARTQLLESMKETLQPLLGDGKLDELTPELVGELYNKPIIESRAKEAFSKNGIARRNQISDSFFEHEPTSTARADEARENASQREPEFNGQLRMLMKMDESLFKESEPVTVESKGIFSRKKVYDSGDKEIDLTELEGENSPIAKF